MINHELLKRAMAMGLGMLCGLGCIAAIVVPTLIVTAASLSPAITITALAALSVIVALLGRATSRWLISVYESVCEGSTEHRGNFGACRAGADFLSDSVQ